MPIAWKNDYDLESEGTLPADWHKDTVQTPVNLEVDDVHFFSSPHGMWVTKEVGSYGYAVTDTAVFTVTDDKKFQCKFWSDGGGITWFQTADQDGGDFNYLKTAALIMADNSSGTNTGTPYAIGYFDGVAWVDTGFTYTPSAFNLLEWKHDFTNNRFDLWVNSVAAGTNLSFRLNQTQVEAICIYTDDEVWLDNFQVGEAPSAPALAIKNTIIKNSVVRAT